MQGIRRALPGRLWRMLRRNVALWVARLNEALKNTGQTLNFTDPVEGPASAGTISDLIADMREGQVNTLIIVDANAVYATHISVFCAPECTGSPKPALLVGLCALTLVIVSSRPRC
ncbi:MAG: hypothetical protein NTAFB05_21670 [Nitrobacter sp.]|uniref:hypothetical protein n=1 Tax=Nitrobacter sp. TaxID=29420 RepID=UPI00387DDC0E